MVLRLAYFVLVHEIPRALVINADHTGIMFSPMKGKMWITEEQAKAKDKKVARQGDKRQFTCLASTSASGDVLPHQVVVSGKTSGSLPKFGKFISSVSGVIKPKKKGAKERPSFSFILDSFVASVRNIGSFSVTCDHWSDNLTSQAYVKDIAVPYFRKMINSLRTTDASACKPFGQQICILIIDCWWGWLDSSFRSWLKEKYPWIRLVFVPANCTPIAQPMDAGIIAKLKGKLRKLYGSWVCALTQKQLQRGTDPKDIKVPADVPSCKKNLFQWLSHVVDMLKDDKEGIVHCWEKTKLLCAWDRSVQVEAFTKKGELFPNLDESDSYFPQTEDEDAGDLGVPFTQPESEEEWMGWVDWGQVQQGA